MHWTRMRSRHWLTTSSCNRRRRGYWFGSRALVAFTGTQQLGSGRACAALGARLRRSPHATASSAGPHILYEPSIV